MATNTTVRSPLPCINCLTQLKWQRHAFSHGTVQRVDSKLIHPQSHYRVVGTLIIQKEPNNICKGTLETTRMILKTTQTSAEDNNSKKQDFHSNIFKEYKITYLTIPNEFSTINRSISSKEPSGILALEWLVPTEFYLLLRRTYLPGHTVSSKEGHNASKIGVNSTGLLLGLGNAYRHLSTEAPYSDVILDQMLICIGQSQDRVEESTRCCWMRECVPHHKTSSICQSGLPSAIPLRD
jgi:hypothetical protein